MSRYCPRCNTTHGGYVFLTHMVNGKVYRAPCGHEIILVTKVEVAK